MKNYDDIEMFSAYEIGHVLVAWAAGEKWSMFLTFQNI